MATVLVTLIRVIVVVALVNQVLVLRDWGPRAYALILPIWKGLRYRPGISVALRRMAAKTRKRGDNPGAIQLAREAVQLGLGRPSQSLGLDLLSLAETLYGASRFAQALEWFRLADAATREDFRWKGAVLVEMAYCLRQLGHFADADSVLVRASRIYKPSPGWWPLTNPQRWARGSPRYLRQVANAQGYVAMMTGRFADARRFYKRVQDAPGRRQRAERLVELNNLAAASVQQGDLPSAERYVAEASSLAGGKPWPGWDYFLGTRGDLRRAQGRLKEARADLQQVLTLRGPDPRTLVCLAEVALQDGARDEAEQYVNQIQGEPDDPQSRKTFAQLLEQLAALDDGAGRRERADQRRLKANRLREPARSDTYLDNDTLLMAARSALAGRQLTGLSAAETLAVCTFLLAVTLFTVAAIVVNNPPIALALFELLLAIVLFGGWIALSNGMFAAKPSSTRARSD